MENDKKDNRSARRYLRRLNLKRRKKIRIYKAVNVIACAMTFVVIAVCMIVIKRPKISDTENRTLAKWPSFSFSDYFSGEYTSGIENFYNDTVPGREKFKEWTADIRSLFGLRSEEVKIHGTPVKQNVKSDKKKQTTAVMSTENSQSTKTTLSSVISSEPATEPTEDPLDDPNIDGEMSNNILVYNNRGIMLYGGSYDNGELYAQYVNAFKSDLGDVNVYSMVCPTPVSYYLPKKYSDLSASEEDNIKNINEYLDGVTPVDAYNALKAHKDEDIFKRTDHHWSQLGAYYAAEEFAKTAGVPYASLSKYEKVTKHGYVGTLYGYSQDTDLLNNPEDFTYYIPQNTYTTTYYSTDMTDEYEGNLLISLDNVDPVSWYLVFMGTDAVVTHVHTDVENGRKLAIVKDSYGNALVPCLTGSFEDIYVIDMRYFEVNAVAQMQEWGVTDLLFAMNTFSATGSNFECIDTIRTQ